MSLLPDIPVLAHPIQHLFLNQLPIQRPYPLLAEVGAAEEGVEVLLRQKDVIPVILLVGKVVFVQQDARFSRYPFRRQLSYALDRLFRQVKVPVPQRAELQSLGQDIVKAQYNGESQRVVMEFDNTLLDTVVDRLGADDVIYHSEGKDRFVVNAEIEVSPQFFAWVFGLGKGAKIISPASAVEGMKKHLAEVMAAYE